MTATGVLAVGICLILSAVFSVIAHVTDTDALAVAVCDFQIPASATPARRRHSETA